MFDLTTWLHPQHLLFMMKTRWFLILGEFNESDVTNKLVCIEEKTRKISQPLKKLNFRFI